MFVSTYRLQFHFGFYFRQSLEFELELEREHCSDWTNETAITFQLAEINWVYMQRIGIFQPIIMNTECKPLNL